MIFSCVGPEKKIQSLADPHQAQPLGSHAHKRTLRPRKLRYQGGSNLRKRNLRGYIQTPISLHKTTTCKVWAYNL